MRVRALREAGFAITLIETADKAWEFFQNPHPEICAVILDIMMPPGKYLTGLDNDEGLRSGVFLYAKLVETEAAKEKEILSVRGYHLPVAILTNVTNPETLQMLQEVSNRHPNLHLRIWAKMTTSPMTFAGEFDQWASALAAGHR